MADNEVKMGVTTPEERNDRYHKYRERNFKPTDPKRIIEIDPEDPFESYPPNKPVSQERINVEIDPEDPFLPKNR